MPPKGFKQYQIDKETSEKVINVGFVWGKSMRDARARAVEKWGISEVTYVSQRPLKPKPYRNKKTWMVNI